MSREKRQRKRRKDYQSKRFDNPFYKKRSKKKGIGRVSFKSFLITLLILFIIFGLFWFFYFSSTFTIKQVGVNGLERVNPDEIKDYAFKEAKKDKIFSNESNLFAISIDNLKKDLQNNYNFATIEVNKKLPDTLEIYIKERSYDAIFLENGDYYFIDNKGYVVDKINDIKLVDPVKYPIIKNESDLNILDNKVGVNDDTLKFINKFYNHLQSFTEERMVIENFIVKDNDSSLSAQVLNGPVLYLSKDSDVEEQSKNLIILKQEEIKDDFGKIIYIDLRYGDKLFYR